MRRTFFIIGSIVVLLVVGGLYLRSRGGDAGPVVQTEAARQGTLVSTVVESGSVESIAQVRVAPLVAGHIAQTFIAAGQQVRAGEALFTIEDDALQARLRQSQASLERARAGLSLTLRGAKPEETAAQKTAVTTAESMLASAQKSLAATQSSAQSDVATASAQVATSQARAASLQSKLQDARTVGNAEERALRDQADTARTQANRLDEQRDLLQSLVNTRITAATNVRDAAQQSGDAAALQQAQDALDTLKRSTDLELQQAEDRVEQARDDAARLDTQAATTQTRTQQTVNDLQASIVTANAELAAQTAAARAQGAQAIVRQESAAGSLTQAQGQLASAQAQLGVLTRNLTDVDLAVAKADLTAAQAAADEVAAGLANYTVTAPVAGTITAFDLRAGESAAAFQTALTIADLARLRVLANISETEIARIVPGQEVVIDFDAFDAATSAKGRVIEILPAPVVLQGVIFYQVRISLDAPQLVARLRPGMTANLTIQTKSVPLAIIVPARAVKAKDGVRFVTVQKPDGALEDRTVQVGERGDDGIQILSGISAGELVVTSRKP